MQTNRPSEWPPSGLDPTTMGHGERGCGSHWSVMRWPSKPGLKIWRPRPAKQALTPRVLDCPLVAAALQEQPQHLPAPRIGCAWASGQWTRSAAPPTRCSSGHPFVHLGEVESIQKPTTNKLLVSWCSVDRLSFLVRLRKRDSYPRRSYPTTELTILHPSE